MSFIEIAHAMGPQAGAGGGEANVFASLMPFALIFVVFYFLLIRPQQKKAKDHKLMLAGLKVGDPVITAGGMYGRIIEVDGDLMVVDLGETKVTMNRGYLTAVPQQRQAAPPAKREKKGKKDAKDTKDSKNMRKATPEALTAASLDEAADESVDGSVEGSVDAPVESSVETPAETATEESRVVSGGSDSDKPAVQ